MAKLKSAAKAKPAAKSAEGMPRSIMDSAQQIWLAGMGAFGRAQDEGTKLFEALVKEGSSLEQKTRKLATGKVDAVRDAVENRVGAVKERAADTWDRLEKVFEDRVQRALTRLGVPGREDLQALIARVDTLNAELRKLGGGKGAAPSKTGAKPAAKARPKKSAAKKAAKDLTD
jgi:poly(hydroxyalkanoate) granule-associated protein